MWNNRKLCTICWNYTSKIQYFEIILLPEKKSWFNKFISKKTIWIKICNICVEKSWISIHLQHSLFNRVKNINKIRKS